MITLTPDKELVFVPDKQKAQKTVCVELKIGNTSSTDRVLFKIKTTKPQNYHVKPNSGIIPVNGFVTIQVALLEAAVNQPTDSKAKEDKFLVQTITESDCGKPLPTVIEPKDEAAVVKDWWASVEAKGKADKTGPNITKNKLTCRLVQPDQGVEASTALPAAVAAAAPAPATQPTSAAVSKPAAAVTKTTTPAAKSAPAREVTKPKAPATATTTSTDVKVVGDQSMPSIILLFVVFLLGVIMGKFVI
eukprot:m.25518 g.25518  ORF g.25518 m.25518 type:complete len:247 (+) comp11520_c0_seq1:147-887(+)